MYTISYFDCEVYLSENISIPQKVSDAVTQAQNYFGKCREYYYNVCERNECDSFVITHNSPYFAVSPRIDVPASFKSLGMELDPEIEMMVCALLSIKTEARFERYALNPIEDLYVNRNLKFCDDTVSYRKIFFENDPDEVRKMYAFFDNEEHFNKNRVSIMKDFNEYHDNNMTLIQNRMPYIYPQITR
jgi:hypothetical protein